MQATLILLTCLAAQPDGVAAATAAAKEQVQAPVGTTAVESITRGPRELSNAVGEAIRRFQQADEVSREPLVPELAALYSEVQNHTQLDSRTRRRLARLLERRLREMEASLVRRLQPEDHPEHRRQSEVASTPRVATTSGAPARSRTNASAVLAQPVAQAAGAGAAAGGIGQPPNRQAQDLIDLIRTTIAPSTWSINGGKGTIYYFRPSQALVIRQTSEVHGQIGGTLRQLRP